MPDDLIEVATSDSQWNGVAVSPGGRIFVSLPRWRESEDTFSVGEIRDGSLHPFPGGDWNTWHPTRAQANPQNRFVCVNAVHTDRNGSLWVVDAGVGGDFGENRFLPDGPKLVRFELRARATLPQVYPLGKAAPARRRTTRGTSTWGMSRAARYTATETGWYANCHGSSPRMA